MKKLIIITFLLLVFNILNTANCWSQRKAIALDVDQNTDFDEGLEIGEDLNVSSNATININNGDFVLEDDFKVYGTAKFKIKGGSVIINDGVGLYSDGKISSFDSSVSSLYIGGSIFVGNEDVSHTLEIEAGEIKGKIWVYSNSLVKITGHGFNFDYKNIRYTEFDEESGVTTEYNREGHLTGILKNGDEIDCDFRMMGDNEPNILLISDE
jgi:hypothetical protein